VVAVAAVLVAALLPSGGHHDARPPARPAASRVAPSASPAVSPGKIYNSRVSASALGQSLADEVDAGDGTRYQQSELEPLPASAFRAPVAAYRHYAIAQSRAMAVPVARLLAAVRRGDRAGAKRVWSSAYDRYLLLGAAYGALGDLDVAIDGGAGGLKGGVKDPRFTGLHRVEHDLWSGVPTARVVPFARRLRRDVAQLPHALAVLEITPLDYATRAHEILEDAQRDQMSGRAAKWSGEGLLATAAGLRATDRVLATLDPMLTGRDSTQQVVETQLAVLHRALASVRAAHHGTYPPLPALTERERARVNGALGTALEGLSLVPGTLETTRIPTVKAIP
jgi:high-affinity iron transporter